MAKAFMFGGGDPKDRWDTTIETSGPLGPKGWIAAGLTGLALVTAFGMAGYLVWSGQQAEPQIAAPAGVAPEPVLASADAVPLVTDSAETDLAGDQRAQTVTPRTDDVTPAAIAAAPSDDDQPSPSAVRFGDPLSAADGTAGAEPDEADRQAILIAASRASTEGTATDEVAQAEPASADLVPAAETIAVLADPDDAGSALVTALVQPATDAQRYGRTTDRVNLRRAPELDAEIIEIIPTETEVATVADCTQWCRVEHNDLEGYVWADLLWFPDPVEVAETEAEVVALESELSELGAAYFEVAETPESLAAQPVTDGLVPRRTNRYVNMRAAPDNDGRVLRVVPANADIFADPSCTHWCEVAYEGQRGFIYTSFIRR